VLDLVDHLLLGVADREAGIRWVEERTGMRPVIGGSHPGVGTWNALLSLGGRQYLEIIAPDPAQAQLADRYRRLRALDTPQLIMWAAPTDNAAMTASRCRAAGLGYVREAGCGCGVGCGLVLPRRITRMPAIRPISAPMPPPMAWARSSFPVA